MELAMSVIDMPALRTTVNYNDLPTAVQNAFDKAMEQADNATTAHAYEDRMTVIAALTGLRPRYNDIRKCACDCTCPLIFDADDPDVRVIEETAGYNLGRLQCPDCADDHPAEQDA